MALAVTRTARYIYKMYENFQSRCNIIEYLNMKMTLFSISDACRIKFKHWQEKAKNELLILKTLPAVNF